IVESLQHGLLVTVPRPIVKCPPAGRGSAGGLAAGPVHKQRPFLSGSRGLAVGCFDYVLVGSPSMPINLSATTVASSSRGRVSVPGRFTSAYAVTTSTLRRSGRFSLRMCDAA